MRELTNDLADCVILDEESQARTYDKVGVEIAILDGTSDSRGMSFASDCVIEFNNPVPLTRCPRPSLIDIIGTAVLYRQGKQILADMFIRHDSPERLLLETSSAKLYPAIEEGAQLQEGGVRSHVTIQGISLGLARNLDSRIGPV